MESCVVWCSCLIISMSCLWSCSFVGCLGSCWVCSFVECCAMFLADTTLTASNKHTVKKSIVPVFSSRSFLELLVVSGLSCALSLSRWSLNKTLMFRHFYTQWKNWFKWKDSHNFFSLQWGDPSKICELSSNFLSVFLINVLISYINSLLCIAIRRILLVPYT